MHHWDLLSPKTVEVGIVYSPSPKTLSSSKNLQVFEFKGSFSNLTISTKSHSAMCSLVGYMRIDRLASLMDEMTSTSRSRNLLSLLMSATTPMASVASPSDIRVHMIQVRSPGSLQWKNGKLMMMTVTLLMIWTSDFEDVHLVPLLGRPWASCQKVSIKLNEKRLPSRDLYPNSLARTLLRWKGDERSISTPSCLLSSSFTCNNHQMKLSSGSKLIMDICW